MLDLLWMHLVTLQTIIVNSTTPCFQNNTAGPDIWKNCGMGTDYIKASLIWVEYITGGWFSMILVSMLVLISYLKYQKAIYPVIIGAFYLPISFMLFPAQFLTWAFVMAGMLFGILVWYAYVSQSNES